MYGCHYFERLLLLLFGATRRHSAIRAIGYAGCYRRYIIGLLALSLTGLLSRWLLWLLRHYSMPGWGRYEIAAAMAVVGIVYCLRHASFHAIRRQYAADAGGIGGRMAYIMAEQRQFVSGFGSAPYHIAPRHCITLT